MIKAIRRGMVGVPTNPKRKRDGETRFLAYASGSVSIGAGQQPVKQLQVLAGHLSKIVALVHPIAACGARVTHTVIHALVDGVFHARLVLDVQGRHAELDARSSDAMAVAVRVGIPILVEEAVLEQAGLTPQPEPGAPGAPDAAAGPSEAAGQERIGEEQLGAFRDVIRGLNLDDLGRPGPPS